MTNLSPNVRGIVIRINNKIQRHYRFVPFQRKDIRRHHNIEVGKYLYGDEGRRKTLSKRTPEAINLKSITLGLLLTNYIAYAFVGLSC